jgi:lysyl-tRNA synthetase class 2
MQITQNLLCTIHSACEEPITDRLHSLQGPYKELQASFQPGTQFNKIPFLPTLMDQINMVAPDFRLPKLLSEDAVPQITLLFEKLKLPLPASPTIARLLDSLASHFIEPLCQEPTFITNHPAIMSPLAKSFVDPDTGHLVSARAEFFVRGTEYINMYEEENDPFLQAQKFLMQTENEGKGQDLDLSRYGNDEIAIAKAVNSRLTPGQRYYIRVLEMGLPPTGGWGCGIDRLVMLFGGAKRINDVLPFGNLRNVIAMGTDGKGGVEVKEVAKEAKESKDTVASTQMLKP